MSRNRNKLKNDSKNEVGKLKNKRIMHTLKKLGIVATFGILAMSSCKKDEETEASTSTTSNLTMNFTGLEDLGEDYTYEGWIIVDGSAVSAGVFTVDANGNMSQTSFSLPSGQVSSATAYVLTIEPSPDSDPTPSDVHILGGDFSGSSASLTVGHSAAINTDFTASTGGYILATPTDGGATTDENSGVWWLDPSAGPGAALDLPELPAGWMYEGWAVIDGVPVTTGKFTSVSEADKSAIYSETTAAGPAFPGEDFLLNAPANVSFPTDLAGKTVVISVEPNPDNSDAPFTLKPLVGNVPASAIDHTLYTMENNATGSNPTGTATR